MTLAPLVMTAWLGAGANPAAAAAGPAQPAPSPTAPVIATTDDHDTPWLVAVSARVAYRTDATAGAVDLDPRFGLSFGASFERRHARLGKHAEFSVGLDLFHDRFATSVDGSAATEQGAEIPFDGIRIISQTTFALAETMSVRVGGLRPFLGIGGGVAVGYFTSDESALRPGEARTTRPLGRLAAGVDIDFDGGAGLVLRADYGHIVSPPEFQSDDGRRLRVFGDLIDAGVGFRYRF